MWRKNPAEDGTECIWLEMAAMCPSWKPLTADVLVLSTLELSCRVLLHHIPPLIYLLFELQELAFPKLQLAWAFFRFRSSSYLWL